MKAAEKSAAGSYIDSGAETFNEYRKLRDSGYTKEEATAVLIKEVPLHILSAKADDYLGKNSRIDDTLFARYDIKRKVDSTKKKKYNGIKLDKEEYARLSSAVGTYKPMERGKVSQILDNKDGDPAFIYDVFVDEDGRMIVLGKHPAQNIHERENTKDAYRKRKKSYLRNR